MLNLLRFLILSLVLGLVFGGAVQAQISPICDLLEDANGDCIVDNVGNQVCVRGVVLAWKQFGVRGPGHIWDPEADCSIGVFDITDAPDVAIGNLVEVCAWTGNFAGLAELTDDPTNDANDPVVVDLGVGPAYPIIELTAAELADFSPLAEEKESFLVRLCGEFLTTGDFAGNTNYEFQDTLGDICIVRIDADVDLVGTAIPAEQTEVLGILGQFNNFTDTCIGYQVLPRFVGDVLPGECTPISTETESWSGVKDLYR